MEVKGIGQSIPARPPQETAINYRFEEVFDESRKQFVQLHPATKAGVDPHEIKELGSLKSPYIDNNPMFTSLKKWMLSFHKELQDRSELDKDSGYHLKVTLYGCLSKLLREIVNTSDRGLQVSYLQRVYDWFVRRKREKKKGFYDGKKLIKLAHPMQGMERSSPTKNFDPSLTGGNLQLYQQKMRTYYPDLKPPKDRLEEFDHRSIYRVGSPQSELEASENGSPVKRDAVQEEKELIFKPRTQYVARSVGIEARSNFLFYQPTETLDEQKLERLWLAKKNKDISGKRTEEEMVKQLKEWGHAKGKFNSNLVRKFENLRYANNFQSRGYENSHPTKSPRKPRSKSPRKYLSPDNERNHYKGLYDQPSSDEAEENEVKMGNDTSKQVSPDQIRQLHNALSQGQLPPPSKSPRPSKKYPQVIDLRPATQRLSMNSSVKKTTPDPSLAFSDMDQQRIAYIRRMYGGLIGATEDHMASPANTILTSPTKVKPITLSPYNKDMKRPHFSNRSQSLMRGFPLTHLGNRDMHRMRQIQEIDKLKQHLASQEIPCRPMSLERAILIPEDYPAEMMTADHFIRPGSRLMVNPFSTPRKGRKGKKKKKKT